MLSQVLQATLNRPLSLTLLDLQEQMELLKTTGASGGERQDAIDHCQAGITRLSDAVKDASSIIPAYDQRTYGDAIKALSNKLTDIKTTLAPRPKFAFKSGLSFSQKKNASAISLNDAAELAAQRRKLMPGYADSSNESSLATTPAHLQSPVPETAENGSVSDAAAFAQGACTKIDGHIGLHIILPPKAAHATSSGTLSNLRNCVVDLSSPTSNSPFAGLTLKNIRESIIVCGRVSGAVHLTNIKSSVIVVATGQFRMHESKQCDVYLLAMSRPIIEDCSGIRFAPLPDAYLQGGDQEAQNMYAQVDDFKWLRNEPSPNWSLLPKDGMVDDKVWRETVPGAGLSVDDILRAVRLPT